MVYAELNNSYCFIINSLALCVCAKTNHVLYLLNYEVGDLTALSINNKEK